MVGIENQNKGRKLGINSTNDSRLVLIDPTSENFFDYVIGYDTEDNRIKDFINKVKEVKEAGVAPFWKPIYDPSLDGEAVIFDSGRIPAVGHSFNFWKHKAECMPKVKELKWRVGSWQQYYAFLVWLINNLIKQTSIVIGTEYAIDASIKSVVQDSKRLGHYANSRDAQTDFEKTGSRQICGVYDLGNTIKILSSANRTADECWYAGGNFGAESYIYPLGKLENYTKPYIVKMDGVGWLVLS